MGQLGTCKNCVYWDKNDGECNAINQHDTGFGWNQNPEIAFEVTIQVDDDSGLWWRLKTGPEFGCVRFKEKV